MERRLRENPPDRYNTTPQAKVHSLCTSFISEITNYIDAKPGYIRFLRAVLDDFEKLAMALSETRLIFPLDKPASAHIEQPDPDVILDDKDKGDSLTSRIQRINVADEFSLDEVRALISRLRIQELEPWVPWPALDHFMKISARKWEEICLAYFGKIEDRLEQLVLTECSRMFVSPRTSGLSSAVRFVPLYGLADSIVRKQSKYLTRQLRGLRPRLSLIASGNADEPSL